MKFHNYSPEDKLSGRTSSYINEFVVLLIYCLPS